MLRVIGCLRDQHDALLLLGAAAVCLLSGGIALWALAGANMRHRRGWERRAWLWLAALVAGGGAWATHFVAMLAYDPGLPTRYDGLTTLLSVLLVAAVSLAAMRARLAAEGSPALRAAAGALFGVGIGAMHYLGMSALRVSGQLVFGADLVLFSLLAGMSLSAAAFALPLTRARRLPATLLLGVAILSLHVVGMGAVSVLPDGAVPVPTEALDRRRLAVLVLLVSLFSLLLGLAGFALRARMALAAAEAEGARLRGLADASFEGIAVCDQHHRVIEANQPMADLLGRPRAALIGLDLGRLLLAGDGRDTAALLDAAERGAVAAGLDAPGGPIPVEVRSRTIATARGPRTVAALRDLRERLAAERRIRHMAHHDPLTDLGNRTMLEDRLRVAAARVRRGGAGFALHCLDLDRFKAVNDAFGHAAGDRLLRAAADRIRAEVRETDVVARIGGDEFVVIQSDVGRSEEAAQLASRLVSGLSAPYDLGEGREALVSASVGVALFPADAADTERLLLNADTALYRTKRGGRNGYAFFRAEMDEEARLCRALEGELRLALPREQLHLLYQPQANAATGEVVGFEALLRWTHPVRGPIGPDVFIPIAEGCGAILPIGAWVLRTACAEAAGWERPLRISVNASPAQIQQPDFAALVAATLRDTGLAPERLEIEITESMLAQDAERALATLRAVRALGVQVAMDDFGTGYSSLSTLRAFPFSRIKVDRSFVRDLGDSEQAVAIVRAVLGLGRGLGLPVVAEGVETASQYELLRAERCEEVQGYLLGRPMTVEALAGLVGVPSPPAPPPARSDAGLAAA